MTRPLVLFACIVTMLPLTGCGGGSLHKLFNDAEYWQRIDIREAAYMPQDKAQNLLHRHISQCVSTLREQETMAALRANMPGDEPRTTPAGDLAHWDTPAREAYLYAEHQPFHDFEHCMQHKGWERTKHITPAVGAAARSGYLDHVDPKRKKERTRRTSRYKGTTDDNKSKKTDSQNSYLNF